LGRHGQLYTADGRLQITGLEHKDDPRPIDAECGCYTCRTGFSRGYLRHLFAANELLAYTLASLHNLYFILALMARIRLAIRAGDLTALREALFARCRAAYAAPGVSRRAAGGQ